MGTGSSWKRPIATWSVSTRAPAKSAGRYPIADLKLDYTSTVAPVIIGNHVIAGIGGDHLDNPGFIQSRDPETGALQWKWYTTPRKGEPGMDTWPDEYAAAHGTGQTWMPGTYDPELNLYYRRHGQSESGHGASRAARATTCIPAPSLR